KKAAKATPRAVDLPGAGALFLGCAALWCASVSWLCRFLLPLSVVALLAGIAALVRARRPGRSRLTFPGAAAARGGLGVFTALVFPGALGTTYRGYKEESAADAAAIRRVPLPGSPAGAGAEDPEWADASRTALQQGALTVQVDEVVVAEVLVGSQPHKQGKPEVCLLLRLRVLHVP